ncbi:MAG: PadR family transcriptional regulator [Acidimicrobiia bacterium]|nr:PadR family transcriptional regulator [Acidimicrobiia bacterium]
MAPEGLPRRFLPAFLLLTLNRDGTSYGYELWDTTRALGLSVDLAAVYRSLRTMERQDLVTSSWAPSDSGPDRRLYSLTGEGQSAAKDASAELASIRDALASALHTLAVVDAGATS